MLSSKVFSAAVLVLMGLGLIAGNLWFTAARSGIPLSLEGMIAERELRPEKKPGVDDVFLLTFDDGRVIQVDEALYRIAVPGATLIKNKWSAQLRIDNNPIQLTWSRDFRRMCVVMPTVGLAMLASLLAMLRAMRYGEARSDG